MGYFGIRAWESSLLDDIYLVPEYYETMVNYVQSKYKSVNFFTYNMRPD